eukprot:c3789_g1_i2.p1 GENE.c3789_g1_i2~~c3789_g1_i2.p1  ORF type:complete len:176 (-),score=38.44 c3789_g1_i2:47-574(-)
MSDEIRQYEVVDIAEIRDEDLMNDVVLEAYYTKLMSSLNGVGQLVTYFNFKKGELFSRLTIVRGETDVFWSKAFRITAQTARKYINFYKLCAVYPILMSTSFDFTTLYNMRSVIVENAEKDYEFACLLSKTSRAFEVKMCETIQVQELEPNNEISLMSWKKLDAMEDEIESIEQA